MVPLLNHAVPALTAIGIAYALAALPAFLLGASLARDADPA